MKTNSTTKPAAGTQRKLVLAAAVTLGFMIGATVIFVIFTFTHTPFIAPKTASVPPPPIAPQDNDVVMKRGSDFVELLTAGKFDEATKWFDATMSGAMSASTLATVWHQLDIGGKYLGHDAPHIAHEAQFLSVYVPCRWEHNKVDIKVVFDSAGKVSGLWVVPYG